MTGWRCHPLALTVLALAACGRPGTPTNEFSQPAAGSYVLVEATAEEADRAMTRVDALLASKPDYRPLALSNGSEGGGTYSFKFDGPCTARRALVAAVEAEIAAVVTARPRCVDRR